MRKLLFITTLILGFSTATQALDPDGDISYSPRLSRPASNASLTGYLGDDDKTPPITPRKETQAPHGSPKAKSFHEKRRLSTPPPIES